MMFLNDGIGGFEEKLMKIKRFNSLYIFGI